MLLQCVHQKSSLVVTKKSQVATSGQKWSISGPNVVQKQLTSFRHVVQKPSPSGPQVVTQVVPK